MKPLPAGSALAALLLFTPKPGGAQPADTPAFGLTARTSVTLLAFDFVPFDSSGFFVWHPNSPDRYLSGPHVAPLRLPNGAVIEELEIEGCDTANTGEIAAELKRAPAPAANELLVETVNTGVVPTPGCAIFEAPVNPTHAVDNAANKYWIEINMSPGNGSIRFAALRVRYRLQVSPSPAVATFPSDVPTSHPYFRFVEALAAAGITAGCAPGAYCPNSPITRGEMAVFLAAALGLHFPN